MKIKRVHFIGAGYEAIETVYVPVESDNPCEAIKMALKYYKMNRFTWSFDGIEVDKYYVREVTE